jgi:hypothetical protein
MPNTGTGTSTPEASESHFLPSPQNDNLEAYLETLLEISNSPGRGAYLEEWLDLHFGPGNTPRRDIWYSAFVVRLNTVMSCVGTRKHTSSRYDLYTVPLIAPLAHPVKRFILFHASVLHPYLIQAQFDILDASSKVSASDKSEKKRLKRMRRWITEEIGNETLGDWFFRLFRCGYMQEKFKAGLLRDTQVRLVTAVLESWTSELRNLMVKFDGGERSRLEGLAEMTVACMKAKFLLEAFVSSERFRSERTELLILKHLEADDEVNTELVKRQDALNMALYGGKILRYFICDCEVDGSNGRYC